MNTIGLIGIGNEMRGDDAVGMQIAREVDRALPNHCQLITCSGEGAELLEQLSSFSHVYMFDAAYTRENFPGTIYRFDARADAVPLSFFHYSTHKFSVAEAVELGRVLEKLPHTLIIYGVEGQQFDYGAPLHPDVAKAIPEVVQMALQDIAENLEKH